MKRFLIVLLAVLAVSLISCRTTEDSAGSAEQMQSAPPATKQWSLPGVSAGTLSEDEWSRMFPENDTAAAATVPEESVDLPEEETQDIVLLPETEDMTDACIAEEIPEDGTAQEAMFSIVDGEPDTEILFDFGPDEAPELGDPGEMVFAGEEKENWSWLDEVQDVPDTGFTEEIREIVPEKIEDSGWVETMNPDIVGEIARDYDNLHDGISEAPPFMDRVKAFVRQNLLWIYGFIGFMVLVVIIILAISSAKKSKSDKPEREEDEGEEIAMGLDLRPDAQYYRSPISEPEDSSGPDPEPGEYSGPGSSEEEEQEDDDPSDDEYDDGF